MQARNDFDLSRPLIAPEISGAPAGEVNSGKKQWSMTTLYASRPHPKYATRAIAEAWNKRYAGNAKLQVNPDDYPEKQPEVSPERTEATYDRLRKMGDNMPKLKIVDPWD